MTDLRITDLNSSGEDDDFGFELGGETLFLGSIGKGKGKRLNMEKSLVREPVLNKGKARDEVAEAISPSGHITKRRARSRPVSLELLESIHSPFHSPRKVNSLYLMLLPITYLRRQGEVAKHVRRPSQPGNAVAFPRTTVRTHVSSNSSSSSETGSPSATQTLYDR